MLRLAFRLLCVAPTAAAAAAEVERVSRWCPVALTAKIVKQDPRVVEFVVDAFKNGATIPFLARYRREKTKDLDELVLKQIQDVHEELLAVHTRRQSMIKSLEERQLLTPELKAHLDAAETLNQLEDVYEPYKVQRVTLANKARQMGLAPTAKALLHTTDPVDTQKAITEATKKHGEDAARYLTALVAESFTLDKEAREAVFELMWARGELTATLDQERRKKVAQASTDETWEELLQQYKSFDGKKFHPCGMSASVVLAYFRGEARGALRLSLVVDNALRTFSHVLRGKFEGFKRARDTPESRLLHAAIEHSLKDNVSKAVVLQVRRQLKEFADKEAIAVFAHNMRRLLLQRPFKGSLLAMDPGFRAGVKCVILDDQGTPQRTFVVYLHQREHFDKAMEMVVGKLGVRNIAIGNGTASRETQAAVTEVIGKMDPEGALGVQFAVVSEDGASVYSASQIAKEEFPNVDIKFRGAISIGRRLQDPLSELIKIPVQSIGVGLYQHDVQQKQLMRELSHVAQSTVSLVGVNCMTASPFLMRCIPGMKGHIANTIVAMRMKGLLKCRADLRRVPDLDATVFEQVAGFLRFPDSPNWLDNTSIHPESYSVVQRVLEALGLTITKETSKPHEVIRRAVAEYPGGAEKLLHDTQSTEGGRAVLAELQKPQLDPRNQLKYAGIFRTAALSAKSLSPGDRVSGIVRNVTPFGVFVDIGVEDSALLMHPKLQQQQQQQQSGRGEVSAHMSPISAAAHTDFFKMVNVGDILENMTVMHVESVQRGGAARWLISVAASEARVVNTDEDLEQLAPRVSLEGGEKRPPRAGRSFISGKARPQSRAAEEGEEQGSAAQFSVPPKSISTPKTADASANDDGEEEEQEFDIDAPREKPPPARDAEVTVAESSRQKAEEKEDNETESESLSLEDILRAVAKPARAATIPAAGTLQALRKKSIPSAAPASKPSMAAPPNKNQKKRGVPAKPKKKEASAAAPPSSKGGKAASKAASVRATASAKDSSASSAAAKKNKTSKAATIEFITI